MKVINSIVFAIVLVTAACAKTPVPVETDSTEVKSDATTDATGSASNDGAGAVDCASDCSDVTATK